jgi:septum formation protein
MQLQSPHRELILASASPYRKALLERFGIPFSVAPASVDESPLGGEAPRAQVSRLASAKAHAVATQEPEAVVIGSDQLAVFGNQVMGKPGNAENAEAQLLRFSGQSVLFLTAVTVVCAATGFHCRETDETQVQFRQLSLREIRRYIAAEKPFDCAGGFKAEAMGIVLFRSIVSRDPTALIGLPLIELSIMLREAGFALP